MAASGCHQKARRIFQGANRAVRDLIAATRPSSPEQRRRFEYGTREGATPLHQRQPEIVLIGSKSPRTLRNFLLTVYAPRRLADCKPNVRGRGATDSHLRSINSLCAFRGCEVTLDQLSDEMLEDYALWFRASGRAPYTVNNRVSTLCALWRYAFKKKWLETFPRDIEKSCASRKRSPARGRRNTSRCWSRRAPASADTSATCRLPSFGAGCF